EARLPTLAHVAARIGRHEAGVTQREPCSAADWLQMIGHGRWRPWHTDALPGVHELCRRPHFEEFALESIWLASCNTGGAPTATFADISCPFPRIEHARPDPPVGNLFRSERSEYPLRRRRNFDRGQNLPFGEVCERLCGATLDLCHFSSRLRFNR